MNSRKSGTGSLLTGRGDLMPLRYDIHMHSSFSPDSDAPMQSMAESAIKRGLEGICFTEHMDLDYPSQYCPDAAGTFEADPEEVLAEVTRLRERFLLRDNAPSVPEKVSALFEDSVSFEDSASFEDSVFLDNNGCHPEPGAFWIGFGLEFGMQPHLAGRFHEIAHRWQPDFLIASQHLVNSLDPYFPDSWKDTDPDDMIASYYREMLSNLKSMQDWDTLAHIDYIIRYIPDRGDRAYDSMIRHREVIDEILRHVISCGKCLEVNTAGYKYGLAQPNPAPAILQRYRELGGKNITIGSDAHEPEQIAFAFDQALDLLRSVGFDSCCVFKRRKPQRIPL